MLALHARTTASTGLCAASNEWACSARTGPSCGDCMSLPVDTCAGGRLLDGAVAAARAGGPAGRWEVSSGRRAVCSAALAGSWACCSTDHAHSLVRHRPPAAWHCVAPASGLPRGQCGAVQGRLAASARCPHRSIINEKTLSPTHAPASGQHAACCMHACMHRLRSCACAPHMHAAGTSLPSVMAAHASGT